MTYVNEIAREIERHLRSDLHREFDISLNNLVIWEIAEATKAERNARAGVTRTTTMLAKARRYFANCPDYRRDEAERRVWRLEGRLERRVRTLSDRAHQLKLALEVGAEIGAEEED